MAADNIANADRKDMYDDEKNGLYVLASGFSDIITFFLTENPDPPEIILRPSSRSVPKPQMLRSRLMRPGPWHLMLEQMIQICLNPRRKSLQRSGMLVIRFRLLHGWLQLSSWQNDSLVSSLEKLQ